jgi:hypothetical protein
MLVVRHVFRKAAPSRGLPHHNKKPWTPRRAPVPPLGLFHFAQNYNSGLLRQSWLSSDRAVPGNAAFTNLMESGTNGAATITGNSRQNLGNLGCWGVGGFGVVAEDALWSRNYFGVNAEIAVRGCHDRRINRPDT